MTGGPADLLACFNTTQLPAPFTSAPVSAFSGIRIDTFFWS